MQAVIGVCTLSFASTFFIYILYLFTIKLYLKIGKAIE